MNIVRIADSFAAEAVAFAWQLCARDQTRSYPLFATQAALYAEFQKCAEHPGGFQAACLQQGTLKGVVFGFSQADSGYLQTTGFYIAEGDTAAACALAAWLKENYAGYTANIGLPAENQTLLRALHHYGYRLLDDTLDLRLSSANFRQATPRGHSVRQIDQRGLTEYLPFHQLHFGDCYWNAQRLQAHFSDWHVYALETERRITGGLFLREFGGDSAEIYGLHAQSEPAAAALLSHAIAHLLQHTPRLSAVIFMADADDHAAVSAALSLGFTQRSRYRCYEAEL